MNFYVGQKVVCVRRSRRPGGGSAKVGQTYTVHGFCNRSHASGLPGLYLCEVAAVEADEWCSCFHPLRFRPVVERKTDISIFKAMLNPSRKEMETTTALESRLVIRG